MSDKQSREAAMVVFERDEHGEPTIWFDPEMVDLVRALSASGVKTVASCSGHGFRPRSIAPAVFGSGLDIWRPRHSPRLRQHSPEQVNFFSPAGPETAQCHRGAGV